MSKKYSGRIHDPNHTRDEYDLYFNDELIAGGTERRIINGNLKLETGGSTIVIRADEPIPDNFYLIIQDISLPYLNANVVIILLTVPANNVYLYQPNTQPVLKTNFSVEKTGDAEITVTLSEGVFGTAHRFSWTIIER